MAKQGGIQLSAAAGTTGAGILTEQFQGDATGISGGGTTFEVQVFKVAWGSTGEFYWADEQTSASGTAGAGAGPLPIQLRDSSGNAISSTAINGSSNRSLDVSLVNQGGSASELYVSSNITGIGGQSLGVYLPIAGSTAGGAIPHIGATTDGYLIPHSVGTQGWEGTISEKLRTITSAIHLMKFGGTGNDGTHYIRGLSADLRSIASGVTFGVQLNHGFTHTVSIGSIASDVTVGISSVSVDNPVSIGSRTAGATFERVNAASTTLQSGVRIKNVAGSGVIKVVYDSAAGSTTGMTQGFELTDREEIFVEVDNLQKVYVTSGVTSGLTFSYYAT